MQRERTGDRTGVISALVTVLAMVGMVIAVPSLLPHPVRQWVGLGPERLGTAPKVSGDGVYAFLQTQPGDPSTPVTYDPCKPIDVRVNPAGGPDDAVALTRAVMAEVGEATGLRFVYDGTTDDRPRWRDERTPTVFGAVRTSPVLVAWADSDEVEALAGRVAGVGGSLAVGVQGGPVRYVTGGVTLDADLVRDLADDPDGAAQQRAIMLHEFGHLVGLDHVEDRSELMFPTQLGLRDFGTGDRRGLALLGQGPCA